MPEQDVLADAFADLMATTPVAAPGPAAARRTVRRRRAATGTLAAVAALAVAGGVAYAAARPAAAPHPGPAAVANPLPELASTIWSDSGRLSAGPIYSDDFHTHPVGWYQVRFMCTGGGREVFTLTVAGGSSTGDAGVPCDGRVRTLTIGTVRDAANAFIRMTPDPDEPAAAGTWALRVDYTTTPPDTK